NFLSASLVFTQPVSKPTYSSSSMTSSSVVCVQPAVSSICLCEECWIKDFQTTELLIGSPEALRKTASTLEAPEHEASSVRLQQVLLSQTSKRSAVTLAWLAVENRAGILRSNERLMG
ncbi:hypothetical protein ILYODFUR_031790, partial [Ilyodon furcidens]